MTDPVLRKAKINEFRTQKKNANSHTKRGMKELEKSIDEDGFVAPMTAVADGEVIDGSARLETVSNIFEDENAFVLEHDGKTPIILKRIDIPDAETDLAKRISIRANRIAEVNLDWNPDLLLESSGSLDLKALFDSEEIAELFHAKKFEDLPDKKPNRRNLPIDIIFCWNAGDNSCCLAIRAGWSYGIRLKGIELSTFKGICKTVPYWEKHKIVFIDNDFKNYVHTEHLEIVSNFSPKYCTVRDIMTKEQCVQAGIEYYSFEQIIDWAEELQQYTENVIIIPKYDCLDKIPEKFMLGYSVPTSYGGTPLPVSSFKGRRVHLLGGSWKEQLKHMAVLGDDVVSLDNNYIDFISNYGQFVLPDGETKELKELGLGEVNNPRDSSKMLSLGFIGTKINELYSDNIIIGE